MYSQSSKPEFVDSTKQKMEHIIKLLSRCGVEVAGAVVREYPTRRSASTYPSAQDGIARREIRLELPDGLSFVERIGYRYCSDKTLRASAAAVYWRMLATINRQRLWMSDRLERMSRYPTQRPFGRWRSVAARELAEVETPIFPHYSLLEGHDRFSRLPEATARAFRPLHRESCGFPSPAQLFEQLGVMPNAVAERRARPGRLTAVLDVRAGPVSRDPAARARVEISLLLHGEPVRVRVGGDDPVVVHVPASVHRSAVCTSIMAVQTAVVKSECQCGMRLRTSST